MRSPEPRAARSFVVIYACAAAILAVVAAASSSRGGVDPMPQFAWIGAASLVVTASLIAVAGIWSATGAYMAVFWCFHFGLVVALASGYLAPVDLSPWDEPWALGPFAAEAAILALAGCLAFASGACLVFALRSRLPLRDRSDPRGETAHAYGFVGSTLVFGALAVWCGIVLSTGGVTGFFSSYEDYLQTTGDFGTTLGVVWAVLGCGIVMAVTGRRAWYRTAVLIAFGCFSLVGLPLGLRSEIMFPTVAALVALARRGRALTPVKAVAFGLALLLVIPVIRDVRESGLRALPDAVLAAPGLDALVEMGGSLHPVEEVVRWHAEGDPYDEGATYWAPFERAAKRLVPGVRSEAADDDLRLMNVLVLDRVGAIGFSPVAEAYRNFGPLGVVIVLGLFGMIVGGIDAVHDVRAAILLIAAVYVPLLVNVRNSFVSVPAQCAVGIVIAVVVAAARHVVGSVLDRPYARAHYIRSEV
ncbi:MAG: O-antigen polysaccharide polymerase Wzy [Betaproteobacteria bacterium]